MIRKQAMRDAATARKQRNRARAKQQSLSVPGGAVETSSTRDLDELSTQSCTLSGADSNSISTAHTSTSTENADYDELVDTQPTSQESPNLQLTRAASSLMFDAIPLLSQYESARARFQVDIADMSILTNFNISRATIPILRAEPSRLAALLGHKQW